MAEGLGWPWSLAGCMRILPRPVRDRLYAFVARNRLRMFEVPINYNGRRYEEGKKITWRDGAAALWFIVRYRFSSQYADSGKDGATC